MDVANQFKRIDLGCGSHKKEGFTGVDQFAAPGVDFVADLEKGLGFIPDHTVEEYYSAHFAEHIRDLEGLMREIHRTLHPGGKVTIIVPHFSNPYFYSDPTHRRFFGLYSFDYFSLEKNPGYRRGVPHYPCGFDFRVVSRKLVFKSPVFPLTNLLKKHMVQPFFNFSPFLQEVYEAFFTGIFHCSEIHFVLTPVK